MHGISAARLPVDHGDVVVYDDDDAFDKQSITKDYVDETTARPRPVIRPTDNTPQICLHFLYTLL